MKLPSEASNSTSVSNHTDIENEFLDALMGDTSPCLGNSSKLDYLVSVGSRSEKPSCSAAGHFANHPAEIHDGLRHYGVYAELGQSREALDNVRALEAGAERRRECLQKRVLLIIAVHLILLCLVDFSLQVILLNCGDFCPSQDLQYSIELGFVALFPFLVLLLLQLIGSKQGTCFSFALLSSYSASFALFFFSVCDLLVGPSKAHRDVSLILFTLTVSFILFSLYVYSRNSITCLYLSFAILSLTVTTSFSLLLVFPDVLDQLPQEMENLLAPKMLPKRTSMWMSYVVGLLFALASVALTTLIFTALRGILFQSSSFSETESAYAAATRVLLRIEMFFVVYPVELFCRLARLCLPKSA